jgi:hypothetical protein
MDGHHGWSIVVVRGSWHWQPLPVVVWKGLLEVDGEDRSVRVRHAEGVDEVLPLVEGVDELPPLVDVGGTGSLMLPAAVLGSHLFVGKENKQMLRLKKIIRYQTKK